MTDIGSLWTGILLGHTAKRIALDELPNGVRVSTVDSPDMGPETALCTPEQGTRIVEYYQTHEEAQEGHKRWIEKASQLKNGDTITDVGYGELIEAESYILSGLNP